MIDLEYFRNFFAQRDNTGVVLGGRYHIYNMLFEKFINQLMTNKVKLKFFIAVHQKTDELNLFIPKMETDYSKYIQLMDKINSNETLLKEEITSKIPITLEYNLMALIKKNCSKHPFQISYYSHAQEIGKYANKHAGQILAIISNDLNLLLFDGPHQFWYANDIQIKSLNIIRFNRNALEISTGLNVKQLQLLSVLLGSSYVPLEITEIFLSTFDDKSSNMVQKLVNYIKKTTNEQNLNLEQIAKDLTNSKDCVAALENGLNCFDIQFKISTKDNDPFDKFSKERNPFIYQLLVDDVYLIKDFSYIDYRNEKLKIFPELIIPLLQKMMGILFQKKSIKPLDRKICIKLTHDEPFRIVQIPVIYPNGKQINVFFVNYYLASVLFIQIIKFDTIFLI